MKKIISVICALAMVCLSAPAFAAEGDAFSEDSSTFSMTTALKVLTSFLGMDKDSARTAFEGAGFEVLMQEHYDKPLDDHSHTSGYTLASGNMTVRGTERSVLVVSVAGTGNGEWYSNFDFAGETGNDCAYAENFMAAAQDIFDGIQGEIAKVESPVVVACGYSRGAACANLLGTLLDGVLPVEDVYVYTFATPNTLRGGDNEYTNIFNIVNVNDCVTGMPLAQWGFSRAGTDIALRDDSVDATPVHRLFFEMLGVCPEIGDYYEKQLDGITLYQLFQTVAGVLSGDNDATSALQTQMTSDAEGELAPLMASLAALLTPDAESGTIGMFSQHMPNVYAQLMMSYSAE